MKRHGETHKIARSGWLRAAVLGANDGIVSTASLILGIAASHASHSIVLSTGIAGLVAGAMSMATGEYVSVSSQSDVEKAALKEEKVELENSFAYEVAELTSIYVQRGLEEPLAREVAEKLMEHDALEAHAKDELGISAHTAARPLQAALASASSFAGGAALPLLVLAITPDQFVIPVVSSAAILLLAFLGGLAAKIGGARIIPGVVRVTFWSALAMGITCGVGAMFGSPV